MNRAQYKCLNCGAVGRSLRCSVCGGDCEPIDTDGIGYTIFDHAQLGHCDNMNLVHRQAGKASERRFTGESITGFGEL